MTEREPAENERCLFITPPDCDYLPKSTIFGGRFIPGKYEGFSLPGMGGIQATHWLPLSALPPLPPVCTPPTSADESAPVTRAGVLLGTITCIQSTSSLRWYGKAAGTTLITWNSHPDPARAIQDVVDFADGKEVAYVKECGGCAGKEVCGE